MKKGYLAGAVICLSLLSAEPAVAQEHTCGDISIASMNWASAEVIAEVDRLILSQGYGCNVRLVTGDTVPTFTSMLQIGEPDLAPELWVNPVRRPLDAAVAQGRLIMATEVLSNGGEEGWWIPRYIADAHPEIKTPADALARPDLFPAPDDGSKGALYDCPSGWDCHIFNSNLFRAYHGGEKGFELIDTRSAAGLDVSIARAFEQKEGWLGYYWAPTAMLGRYEMVKLDMGEHDPQQWDSCTAVPDCPDPQANAWETRQVYSVVTSAFPEKAAVAMDYISKRQWSNVTVNKVLAWMADNQATGAEAAVYFLEKYEDIWSNWVSADTLARVKAGL